MYNDDRYSYYSSSTTPSYASYEINVITSNLCGSGTTANPYIILFGDNGRTKQTNLCKDKNERKNKFQRNSTNSFVLELEDIGNIEKVRLGHDDYGLFSGWHVDRVEIKKSKKYDQDSRILVFPCKRWLARSEGDGSIEVDLVLEKIIFEIKKYGEVVKREQLVRNQFEVLTYTVDVYTGDVPFAGTNANVYITLFGDDQNDSGEKRLIRSEKGFGKFERNKMDRFLIKSIDLGTLRKIKIRHDDSCIFSDWFLDRVEISDSRGRGFIFPCDSWLSKTKLDKKIERQIYEKSIPKTSVRALTKLSNTNLNQATNVFTHWINIYTGDLKNAGTDSNVIMKIFGSNGSSGDIKMKKLDNRFSRGSIDTVKVDLDDIGSLIKIRVSLDPKAIGKDWYLEKVEIVNEKTQHLSTFDCKEWFSKSKRESLDIPLSVRGHEIIASTDYRISVKTSDIFMAGTDANVFLTIFGANGDSGELGLKTSQTNFDKFERNRIDIFTFKNILSLGELCKCRIRHDNSTSLLTCNPSWHLEYVKIDDLTKGKSYMFICKKWLSLTKDDKQIVRELVANNRDGNIEEQSIGDKTIYEIHVTTADEKNAGTTQNAMVILVGENNRETKTKYMENSYEEKLFRRGQKDLFLFKTKSVGPLKKLILGHIDRDDEPSWSEWHVKEISVLDTNTGISYVFPVDDVLVLNQEPRVYRCESKKETLVNKTRKLKNVDYEVIVFTGQSGTDCNVYVTLFGENGDSGKRLLRKGLTINRSEKFIVECLELGKLRRIHFEHEVKSPKNALFLEEIEVKDPTHQQNSQVVVFPCKKWFALNKEDGEIERDLFPEDSYQYKYQPQPLNSGRKVLSFREDFNESRIIDRDLDTFKYRAPEPIKPIINRRKSLTTSDYIDDDFIKPEAFREINRSRSAHNLDQNRNRLSSNYDYY